MQLGITNKQFIESPYRAFHTHVIGKAGTGKSTTILRWMVDDVYKGEGFAYVHFHHSSFLSYILPHRWDDVILFTPSDRKFPAGLNLLEGERSHVLSAVIDMVKAIWPIDIPTPNIDLYVQAATASPLERPRSTLHDVYFLLTDARFRKRHGVKDKIVKHFWSDFDTMPDKERRAAIGSTFNKVLALMLDPTVRNIVGQPRSTFDLGSLGKRFSSPTSLALAARRPRCLPAAARPARPAWPRVPRLPRALLADDPCPLSWIAAAA